MICCINRKFLQMDNITLIKQFSFIIIWEFTYNIFIQHRGKDLMNNFQAILELALREDLNNAGDVTSQSIFSDEIEDFSLIVKDDGILAGSEFFKSVFHRIDPDIEIRFLLSEGGELTPGKAVAKLKGAVTSVLQGERTAINFLGFLSGIATETKRFTEKAAETGNTVILDTRKTLPGYRELSKYAVRVGGGQNHRMGLWDMVLIKDNHIDASGSIAKAIKKVRGKWGSRFPIEVECRDLHEVAEALDSKVDRIMLDNMDIEEVKKAVAMKHGKTKFESSGNMDYAKTALHSAAGVDFISVGSLTHSVTNIDFSLTMKKGHKNEL